MGGTSSTQKDKEAIEKFDDIFEKQKQLTKCAEQVATLARSQEDSIKELQKNIETFRQKHDSQEPLSKSTYRESERSQHTSCGSSTKTNHKELSQNEIHREGRNNDYKSDKWSCNEEKPRPPNKPFTFPKDYTDKLFTFEDENKKLSNTVKELKSETKHLKEAINGITSDNNDLREDVNKIFHLEKENARMKNKIDELELEAGTLKGAIQKLTNLNEDFKAKINKTESELQRLHHNFENLEKTLTQKETVHVALHCSEQQKLAVEVLSDLKSKLITQMAVQSCNLQTEINHDVQNRAPGVPLILLCFTSSRLGVDVDRAFRNIQYESSVALVILHYAKSHALPSRLSEHLLTEAKYKKLGLIVDMAYVTEEGIYSCDMNNICLNKLCEFIKRFI